MLQGWSIDFTENIFPYLDDVVGSDSDHMTVESAVMDGAHGDAVRNDRLPAVGVLLDMSGIEELWVPESAKCAS